MRPQANGCSSSVAHNPCADGAGGVAGCCSQLLRLRIQTRDVMRDIIRWFDIGRVGEDHNHCCWKMEMEEIRHNLWVVWKSTVIQMWSARLFHVRRNKDVGLRSPTKLMRYPILRPCIRRIAAVRMISTSKARAPLTYTPNVDHRQKLLSTSCLL